MFTKKLDYNKILIGIIILTSFTILIYCFSNGISGNDFWWHIKVGEWICQNNKVPQTDIFSWYGMEKNIDWTAHEWLSDVIFYGIYSLAGSIGIFIFSLTLSFIFIIVIFNEVKPYIEKNIILSWLFFVFLSVICSMFFYGRPHIFSYFLLFYEMKILYTFYDNNNSKCIFFIPVIACLWSNLHGGSSNLAYILCIVFIIVSFFNIDFGRIHSKKLENKSVFRLFLVFILSVLAILINPIGLEVLIYPYSSMSDTLMLSVISEWASPDAKQIGNIILYFVPIFLISIGILTTKEKVRVIDAVVMLMFLYLFFRSIRFIILWYIAAVFYAFRYFPICKVKKINTKFEKSVIILFIVMIVCLLGMGINITVNTANNKNLISKSMSDDMVQIIKNDNPSRLFNDYNLGEILIYNDIEVFFDSRADLYAQEHIMQDAISFLFLKQLNSESDSNFLDVNNIIKKYGFDAFVIIKDRPLYSYMKCSPEIFECIFEDNDCAYFKLINSHLNVT